MSAPVALIAGLGAFPLEVARGARRSGRRVLALGLRGLADPALEAEADAHVVLDAGQLQRLIDTLREAGVEAVVMAGKVPKRLLAAAAQELRLDARALALVRALADRKDDSILGAIADTLEAEGFRLLEQMAFTPGLWAPEGRLGRVEPTPAQLRDVAFGWPIARVLGDLDVGQTVVVQDRCVLALEAIEGTDAAIRRGCALGRPGACVVKRAKPGQDPRFDLPAVGLTTLRSLAEGQGGVLAVEAGRTVLLEREALLEAADGHGIAVLGVAGGPRAGEQGP